MLQTSAERTEMGKALREQTPRASHAGWQPLANRRDPIEILEESNLGRVPDLIPIRYGRMLASPFAFLRGSAAVMAADLATKPTRRSAIMRRWSGPSKPVGCRLSLRSKGDPA